MIPSLGLSALDQTLFSALSAPKVQSALQNASSGDLVHLSDEALQLQQANGLFGDPGTAAPLTSVLDPGAPNINPSNALEAVDALLLGFTPTSSSAPYSPAGLATPTVNLLA
jgi:hypothetical protein